MKQPKLGFHFQPLNDSELTQTDNAPLLFNSQPLGRKGRVTLFMRTRRTLRKRLGVHDLGQIEGVLQDRKTGIESNEMQKALSQSTQWRYLSLEDNGAEGSIKQGQFSQLVEKSLAV